MTAYVSSQSGNWNDSATWGGAGVPTATDTATITGQHVVTVASATSASCGAITMSAGLVGAKTTLQINGTFDMAGNIGGAAYCAINIGAGGTLDFNGYAINKGSSTYLNWIGAAGNRATVISTGSRGTIPVAAAPTIADFQYCDISGMGAAEYGRTHTTANAFVSYQYCSWTDCGEVTLDGTGNQTTQGCLVSHCDFRNQSGGSGIKYPYLYQTAAKGAQQRTIEYCTWDTNQVDPIEPTFRVAGAIISNNVFANAMISQYSMGNGAPTYINNFFSNLIDNLLFSDAQDNWANIEDSYCYVGPESVHPFGYTAFTLSIEFTGNVCESVPGEFAYGINWLLSTAPFTGTADISNNVFIGEGTVLTFTSAGAAGTITIKNNTLLIDNQAKGDDFPLLFLTEQTGDITGGTIEIYNNIVIDPDTSTAMDKVVFLKTATADQIDFCGYNIGGQIDPA